MNSQVIEKIYHQTGGRRTSRHFVSFRFVSFYSIRPSNTLALHHGREEDTLHGREVTAPPVKERRKRNHNSMIYLRETRYRHSTHRFERALAQKIAKRSRSFFQHRLVRRMVLPATSTARKTRENVLNTRHTTTSKPTPHQYNHTKKQFKKS